MLDFIQGVSFGGLQVIDTMHQIKKSVALGGRHLVQRMGLTKN